MRSWDDWTIGILTRPLFFLPPQNHSERLRERREIGLNCTTPDCSICFGFGLGFLFLQPTIPFFAPFFEAEEERKKKGSKTDIPFFFSFLIWAEHFGYQQLISSHVYQYHWRTSKSESGARVYELRHFITRRNKIGAL